MEREYPAKRDRFTNNLSDTSEPAAEEEHHDELPTIHTKIDSDDEVFADPETSSQENSLAHSDSTGSIPALEIAKEEVNEADLPLPPLPPVPPFQENYKHIPRSYSDPNLTQRLFFANSLDEQEKQTKPVEQPQKNEISDFLKKIGLVSTIGLTAIAGIFYGLSLIIPQLHAWVISLSILQMGALLLGAEFLVLAGTFTSISLINNQNQLEATNIIFNA